MDNRFHLILNDNPANRHSLTAPAIHAFVIMSNRIANDFDLKCQLSERNQRIRHYVVKSNTYFHDVFNLTVTIPPDWVLFSVYLISVEKRSQVTDETMEFVRFFVRADISVDDGVFTFPVYHVPLSFAASHPSFIRSYLLFNATLMTATQWRRRTQLESTANERMKRRDGWAGSNAKEIEATWCVTLIGFEEMIMCGISVCHFLAVEFTNQSKEMLAFSE